MATWTYFSSDLRSNAVLEELPLRGVSLTDELNEPGEFRASLDMFDLPDAARVQAIKEATMPARTALWVDLDGVLQWGGIIWKRKKTSDGVLEITGAGFLSFYARQRIAATASYSGVDQFDIVRALLTYVAEKAGGDIGLDLGTGTTGRLRDRTYEGSDRKQVLEAVTQLSQVIDGFDQAILSAYDGDGAPSKLLALGYPRLGRTKDVTDLVLEYPGNVDSYTWAEEGDRMVTTAYVRGDGDGDATPTSVRTNESLIAGGYPSMEDEWTASGVTVQATLDGYGDAMLAAYAGPAVLPEFTMTEGTEDPALSSFAPGDDFLVEITDPEWWPALDDGTPGYRGSMRLIKRAITPDEDGGGQSVVLTMSPFLGTA